MDNEFLEEKLEGIDNILFGLLNNLVKVSFRYEGNLIAHFDTFAQPAFKEGEKISLTTYFTDKTEEKKTQNKQYTIDKIFKEIKIYEDENGKRKNYLEFDILLK